MKTAIVLLAALGACPALATVVSSGFVEITGLLPEGVFSLTTGDTTVTGEFSKGGWQVTYDTRCCPGQLGTHGGVVNLDFYGGAANIGGIPVPNVYWGDFQAEGLSFFEFHGEEIVVTGPGLFQAPFTFTGSLCGTHGPPWTTPQPCIVDLPVLSGSGIVTVTIEPVGFSFTRARYEFFVPEPGSLMLSGPALLWLIWRRQRRASLQ